MCNGEWKARALGLYTTMKLMYVMACTGNALVRMVRSALVAPRAEEPQAAVPNDSTSITTEMFLVARSLNDLKCPPTCEIGLGFCMQPLPIAVARGGHTYCVRQATGTATGQNECLW